MKKDPTKSNQMSLLEFKKKNKKKNNNNKKKNNNKIKQILRIGELFE